jgi:hypothetical protein
MDGLISNSLQKLVLDGKVAAPGLAFASDPDSGLYRIGANNIGLALNGAKVLDIATTGLSITGTLAASSTITGTSASASALAIGLNGATNPALQVDASTASSATGVKIKSAAAAAGVALSVISSGTNEAFGIDAKGSGLINIGSVSTGGLNLAAGGGNVALNSTTPQSSAGYGYFTANGSTGGGFAISSAGTVEGYLYGNTAVINLVTNAAIPLTFGINNAEAARFDTSGRFLRGCTATISIDNNEFAFAGSSANGVGFNDTAATAGSNFIVFRSSGSAIGTVSNNANTGVLYNTVSDESLKNFDVKQRDFSGMIDGIMVEDAEYKTAPGLNILSISAQQCAQTGYWDGITPPCYEDPEDAWKADYSRLGILALWGVKDLRQKFTQLSADFEAYKASHP